MEVVFEHNSAKYKENFLSQNNQCILNIGDSLVLFYVI